MISGLRIGNFKAFSDTQYVPIRPLTLIFGPNSSGKSSVIHSLLLAHEAMKNGNLDIHRTEIGGDSVDLGGFKQYVYNRDTNRKIQWAIELMMTRNKVTHIYELVKAYGANPQIRLDRRSGRWRRRRRERG